MRVALPEVFCHLLIPEVWGPVKQCHTFITTHPKRDIREAEAMRINNMALTEEQYRVDPSSGEAEQYCRSVSGNEASHNTNT